MNDTLNVPVFLGFLESLLRHSQLLCDGPIQELPEKFKALPQLAGVFVQTPDSILPIGLVNNITTMQFFSGISRNTHSTYYMLSLTECVWEFRRGWYQ